MARIHILAGQQAAKGGALKGVALSTPPPVRLTGYQKWARISAAAAALSIAASVLLGEPPKEGGGKSALSVAEARGRAELLHTTYEATLIAVHRAYFDRGKRLPTPASVLEDDVFKWVDEENGGKTRWISVNTEPMNIDHKPKSEVEKRAAKALASGKDKYELIQDGVYHRAGAVTLVASCLRCHESSLGQKRGRRRVAGLVISIPVRP